MNLVLNDAGLTGTVLPTDPDAEKVLMIARGAFESETDPDVVLIGVLAALRNDGGDREELKDILNLLIADAR